MSNPFMPTSSGIVAALFFLLGCQGVVAQPAVAQAVNCAKAKNPERCEARQKARGACGDMRGQERRQCVREHLPPTDCAKAPNKERCTAMQVAQEACKAEVGPARRQCLREQMPASSGPAAAKP